MTVDEGGKTFVLIDCCGSLTNSFGSQVEDRRSGLQGTCQARKEGENKLEQLGGVTLRPISIRRSKLNAFAKSFFLEVHGSDSELLEVSL